MAVQVELKFIIPKRLKADEVARRGLLNPLRKFTTVIKKDFDATTETWNHKPKFTKKIGLTRLQGPTASVSVSTDDEQYGWVNNGVDARPITPKKGPRLHFQEDFTPKTRPRVIGSRQGGKSGAWTHPTSAPNWPGIEPREFDKAIAEKEQKPFEKTISGELSKAAKDAF